MNHHTHVPQILSGPFGSEAAKLGTSTRNIFAKEQLEIARTIHRRFQNAGVTTGVTPTFAAAPRGMDEAAFDQEFERWNTYGVGVTRDVYGKDVMASVAPQLDTSGGNDSDWPSLGHDWARRRHEGQAHALQKNGVKRVLGEAFRYVDEAKALASLLEDLGFEEFICSFEARHERGRLPHQPNLTYEQVKNELVSATKGNLRVGVGVNCASARDCARVLDNEASGVIDAAYPNKANIGDDAVSRRFIHLAERHGNRTSVEEKEFQSLRLQVEHGEHELQSLVKLCLERRVRYISVCCGGTPEDIAGLHSMVQRLTSRNAS